MTQATIYLDNLRYNLDQIKQKLSPETLICPAVKANAYGHGAIAVSRVLKEEGVSHLAVARVNEARQLRLAGIEGPILLLGHCSMQEIPLLVSLGISPLSGSADFIKALGNETEKQGLKLEIHLKVDTGMGRTGCLPEEALDLAKIIARHPWLEQKGICTHFPVSDSLDKKDQDFTRNQWDQLNRCAQEITSAGIDPGIIHSANSGAIMGHKSTLTQMVRPGIMLYGYPPDLSLKETMDLKPVMELESRVTFVKKVPAGETVSYGRTWSSEEDRWIATLPMGYADGYNRSLSNRGRVWIKGVNYPIAGRVCMDQLMVDLGPETDVAVGDRAIFFGPEATAPDAWELALLLNTIPYEITCWISSRVPRVYK